MNSNIESKKNKPDHVSAFTGWGLIGGAALGVAVGIFTRHWLAWTIGVAVIGWIVGALIDRSRLK